MQAAAVCSVESAGVGVTCSYGRSTRLRRRRSASSLQLCATDAEMLTPAFGELQGRGASQGWNEAQHYGAKRIRSPTPLTFPFRTGTRQCLDGVFPRRRMGARRKLNAD